MEVNVCWSHSVKPILAYNIGIDLLNIWREKDGKAGKSYWGARYDYSYQQRVIDLNQTRQRRFKTCIPLADSGQSLTEPEPELIDHRSPS